MNNNPEITMAINPTIANAGLGKYSVKRFAQTSIKIISEIIP